MSKTVCIIQSNYIPWRGYFDLIGLSDLFIVYDTVQYTKNDWRNRNRIKTQSGATWLTIPVVKRGRMDLSVDQVQIAGSKWALKHWKTLSQAYKRAPYLEDYGERLEALFASAGRMAQLSDVNRLWIDFIVQTLGLQTKILSASDFELVGDRNERLISLCEEVGATRYLSGPSARSYLDVTSFHQRGIEVVFMDYGEYREYPQLHGPFEPNVSILDLILNVGPDALEFMKTKTARSRVA